MSYLGVFLVFVALNAGNLIGSFDFYEFILFTLALCSKLFDFAFVFGGSRAHIGTFVSVYLYVCVHSLE